MIVVLRAMLLAACLLVIGCNQPEPSEPKQDSTPTASPAQATPPKPVSKAVLDAGGIIFDVPGGKTGGLSFGTSRARIDQLATLAFGPPDEQSSNDECDAGPMEFSRYGPLTLNFRDGKLVGWLAREGPQVVTSDGIRPGARMRDLKVARSARMIEDSTLEGEFEYLAADGRTIGGFTKGEGRDATIDSLYAGVNCFFR